MMMMMMSAGDGRKKNIKIESFNIDLFSFVALSSTFDSKQMKTNVPASSLHDFGINL
jgi:hypothetical protein